MSQEVVVVPPSLRRSTLLHIWGSLIFVVISLALTVALMMPIHLWFVVQIFTARMCLRLSPLLTNIRMTQHWMWFLGEVTTHTILIFIFVHTKCLRLDLSKMCYWAWATIMASSRHVGREAKEHRQLGSRFKQVSLGLILLYYYVHIGSTWRTLLLL